MRKSSLLYNKITKELHMAISKCSVYSKDSYMKDKKNPMDSTLKESVFHGTSAFPVAIYYDDMQEGEVIWHWHEEFEVGWITEGQVLIETGNGKFILHQGDGFFINSGMIHAMKNTRSGYPSALKSIVFHGSVIGGTNGSFFDQNYVVPLMQNQALRVFILRNENKEHQTFLSFIQNAWHAMKIEEDGYQLCVRENLSHLFHKLIRQQKSISNCNQTFHRNYDIRTQIMLEFIHRNYAENITLTDIADAASISISEALRCFHNIIGIPPIKYLKKYRLSRAAQLLEESDEPISAISSICGFHDNSYFTKCFHEVYHCSPRDYKKRCAPGACTQGAAPPSSVMFT